MSQVLLVFSATQPKLCFQLTQRGPARRWLYQNRKQLLVINTSSVQTVVFSCTFWVPVPHGLNQRSRGCFGSFGTRCSSFGRWMKRLFKLNLSRTISLSMCLKIQSTAVEIEDFTVEFPEKVHRESDSSSTCLQVQSKEMNATCYQCHRSLLTSASLNPNKIKQKRQPTLMRK